MALPSQATVDARYQAKLSARRSGTTPVIVTEAATPAENPNDPAVIDARYKAKLAARKKAESGGGAAAVVASQPVAEAAPTEPAELAPKETKPEASGAKQQQQRGR